MRAGRAGVRGATLDRWHTDRVFTTTTPRRAAKPRRAGRWVVSVGVLVLVVALGALGWSSYELLAKPPVDPQASAAEVAQLRERWRSEPDADPAAALPGEPVALLRVPAWGDGEHLVVAGTDAASLTRGVGWYAGTAAPGQVGNFAVAGVRGLHGPFARLTELAAGDEVIVETASAVYTYALTNNPVELTVTDTDTWVLQPVPAQPEVRPSQALLTLTTSQDLFRSDTRTVAFGALVSTQSK